MSNNITLKHHVVPSDVSKRIHDALTRHADKEAKGIAVTVKGGEITLRGQVSSWSERAKVYRAAWSAPGVTSVVSDLTVAP